MVDTIANAKGIRRSGSDTSRYGAPSASSPNTAAARAVSPVAAVAGRDQHDPDEQAGHDDKHSKHSAQPQGSDLRLEIGEDDNGGELVYRFVDAQSGAVVREWAANEFGKLRDYMRDKKIHLLDKKV